MFIISTFKLKIFILNFEVRKRDLLILLLTAYFSEECLFLGCYVFIGSMHRLLVTANIVPSSPILVTQMMEALGSSKSVLPRAKWCNNPEVGILNRIEGHCFLLYVQKTFSE
jgi:hypothetical protein